MVYNVVLANALSKHCVCKFLKACNVSASNIVTFNAIFTSSIISRMENIDHDAFKLCINLFEGPRKTFRILRHFQTRSCNTASIGCFTRHKYNAI